MNDDDKGPTANLRTPWASPKAVQHVGHRTSDEIRALRARNAELVAALEPFVALTDERDARYRERGGNPDSFPDGHPSYDINAYKRELPMGAWRKARAALAAAGHKQGGGDTIITKGAYRGDKRLLDDMYGGTDD